MILLCLVAWFVIACGLSLLLAAAGADARLARMTEGEEHEQEEAL